MKITIRIISITLISIIVIIIVGNSLVRVSSSSVGSIGIFEEKFLGKSLFSFLQSPWSENYKRWDTATKGVNMVADTITKFGNTLISDEKLESTRLKMIETSETAYLNAKNIDVDYLRESNSELPQIFSTKLIPTLKLWSEGLKEKDGSKMTEGIKFYNEFLQWMQSKDRGDFNKMR